jgi:hypothetical protein
MPPEASSKRKASDDNSLNSNNAPKSKHTCKDVSGSFLSVFILIECRGTERRLPQAETYAFTHPLLWSCRASTPSRRDQSSTAKSSVVDLLLSTVLNPNSHPLIPLSGPPIVAIQSPVHPIHLTRNFVPTPQERLVRASTSPLTRMAPLKRTYDIWRWRPMPFNAPQTARRCDTWRFPSPTCTT